MDTGEILNKLKAAAPGSVLEKNRFGRSAQASIWVEARALPEVATYLKNDAQIVLDWLENLSAIQMDEAIVLTYFLRSSTQGHSLIVRASVEPSSPSKEADVPSVSRSWAMATPFEIEIQELFGIRFVDSQGQPAYSGDLRLPRGWNGFPLRKSYVFPTRFLGIAHSRRVPGKEGNA